MTWIEVATKTGEFLGSHLNAIGTGLGLGSGVGVIKFLRHMPAPRAANLWQGSVFDTFQDLVSNNGRIGERRNEAGDTIFVKLLLPTKPKEEEPKP